jgi:hypothetical protein
MTTAFWRALSGLGMPGLIFLLWSAGLLAAQATPEQAQLLLHMLDYVAVDYPEFVRDGTVLDQAEYDEQVEFSQQVRLLLDHLPTRTSLTCCARPSNSPRSSGTSGPARRCPRSPSSSAGVLEADHARHHIWEHSVPLKAPICRSTLSWRT